MECGLYHRPTRDTRVCRTLPGRRASDVDNMVKIGRVNGGIRRGFRVRRAESCEIEGEVLTPARRRGREGLLAELLQQLLKPFLRAQGGERRVALDLRAVGEPLLDGVRERPQAFALLAPRRVGTGEVEEDEGVVGLDLGRGFEIEDGVVLSARGLAVSQPLLDGEHEHAAQRAPRDSPLRAVFLPARLTLQRPYLRA